MIFVCVGSREYPFDRLFEALDRLKAEGQIGQDIFAQIGTSAYLPKHFPYERFMDREAFAKRQDQAELIISHAGAGALIGALKKGKRVISVPRRVAFGEHIDDHQIEISAALAQEGYLLEVLDMETLGDTILRTLTEFTPRPYLQESRVLGIVADFLAGR